LAGILINQKLLVILPNGNRINFQFSMINFQKSRNKGFTLIELLISIVIIAIVGTVVVGIFLINLRVTAKTKILTEVKQNGNYALEIMERMIRNAERVQSVCSGSSSNLQILNPDKDLTTFSCGNQIASNSGYLTSSELLVKGCSFNCQQSANKPAVITIQFTLSQKSATAGQEFTAEIPFQTIVSTRSY
jgi:prepilin-type N-terminal cleavage/methylation domain-containing protein